MKTIPLTQGKVAIVDDEDYEELAKYKWCAHQAPNGCWYALRKGPLPGGRQKTIYMHRALMAGDSQLEVDHINGDGLDNRRANLRLVTGSVNQRNQRCHRAGRLVGAHLQRGQYRSKPWRARIRIGAKIRHLGSFATEQEAHERFLRADFERSAAVKKETAL